MTRPAPTSAEVRPAAWYNYVFETDLVCANGHPPGWHPLYEGKSNDPRRRLLEHAETQPWFAHVTGFRIYPQRYGTEQLALAAEAQRIRRNRPLANRQHNELNPCRLDFGPAQVRPRRVAMSRSLQHRRRWPRPARLLAWSAVWWLALAVLVFVALPNRTPAGAALEDSVVAASLLVGGWWLRPKRRRGRRR